MLLFWFRLYSPVMCGFINQIWESTRFQFVSSLWITAVKPAIIINFLYFCFARSEEERARWWGELGHWDRWLGRFLLTRLTDWLTDWLTGSVSSSCHSAPVPSTATDSKHYARESRVGFISSVPNHEIMRDEGAKVATYQSYLSTTQPVRVSWFYMR